MSTIKTAKGVMDAIKGRSGMGSPKKGVQLLSIVQKLSDKRKTQMESDGPVGAKKEAKAE